MNQEKIGKFIKEKRKEKELTQEELAAKLRVSNRTISKWENGVCLPDYALINDLCDELDITINEFLSGEALDEKTYQKKFEENLIKSINYKVKNNNKKILKIIMIIIIVLAIIVPIVFKVVNFYRFYSIENIEIRKDDLSFRKVYYDDFNQNNLANQNILDDFMVYIPNDFKVENDITKSDSVENGCRLFIKNYRDKHDNDAYIKVCTDDEEFEQLVLPDDDFNYKDNNANYYRLEKQYLEIKDINIFSKLYDIKLFRLLTDNFAIYPDIVDASVESHIVNGTINNSIYNVYNYKNPDRKIIEIHGEYEQKQIDKVVNQEKTFNNTYVIRIVDFENVLSMDEVTKIVNSFKSLDRVIEE